MTSLKTTQPPADHPAAENELFDQEIKQLWKASADVLRLKWRDRFKSDAPRAFTKDLLARALAHHLQKERFGGFGPRLQRLLDRAVTPEGQKDRHVKIGSVIVREHQGIVHEVMVVPGGFCWQGQVYSSLSIIARQITGTNWNGHRFFGLRSKAEPKQTLDKGKRAISSETAPSPYTSEMRPALRSVRAKTVASAP